MKLKGSVAIEYVAIVIAIGMFIIPAANNLYQGAERGFKDTTTHYVDMNNVSLVNSDGLDVRVNPVEVEDSTETINTSSVYMPSKEVLNTYFKGATTIVFRDSFLPESEKPVGSESFDISVSQDESIMLNIADNGTYTIYPKGPSQSLIMPNDISGLFKDCSNLQRIEIQSPNAFYVNSVTNIKGLFQNCEKLSYVDTNKMYFSERIRSYESVFENSGSISNLDLSNWNMSNVSNLTNMFKNYGLSANAINFNVNVLKFDSMANIQFLTGIFDGLGKNANNLIFKAENINLVYPSIINYDDIFSNIGASAKTKNIKITNFKINGVEVR